VTAAPLPAWSIRPYRPGDEAQLVALFAQVFGRPITAEWWRWKLKGRPTPVENVWVAAAVADGRVIAQYAGIPVRLQWAGQVRDAMVSVDTMTAPDFRRRGILTALGQAAYARWTAAGVAAVLGLPNQQWGSRTDALGWQRLFGLGWLRYPLHVERALARAAHVPRPLARPAEALGGLGAAAWRASRRARRQIGGDIQVQALTSATADLDALWERLAPEYGRLLVRDRAWVDWRYFRPPDLGYRVLLARSARAPAGYLAYRYAPGSGAAYIADLFTAPTGGAAARALLGAALDDLWARGATSVRVTAAPGSALEDTLRAGGFRRAPGAFDFEVVPLDPALDLGPAVGPDDWLLSGGDFDVV
jgi:GNAT superfamily N-acetyltransferase